MSDAPLVRIGQGEFVKDYTPELQSLTHLAQAVVDSKYIAGVTRVDQALVKMWVGRQIGLPDITSLSEIHFIDGRPTLGIHAMEHKLRSAKVRWKVTKEDGQTCRIEFTREQEQLAIEYTMEDAKRAGLAGKPNWIKHPKDMLYARAFARGARRIASDILVSVCYAPDEIDESPAPVTVHAEVVDPREGIRKRLRELVGAGDRVTAAAAAKAGEILSAVCGFAKVDDIPSDKIADVSAALLEYQA